jgi:hypothetical protein
LAFNGVAISQLSQAVIDGATYARTWVIPMNQPFAELARQLLEVGVPPTYASIGGTTRSTIRRGRFVVR